MTVPGRRLRDWRLLPSIGRAATCGLPMVMWDLGAQVLLDEAADAGGPLWLVYGDDLGRDHPLLDAAMVLSLRATFGFRMSDYCRYRG